MNSISKSLNAATIAATAKMLRSAKKETILIVEGDEDIALFSNSLGIPRSNFISCFGKERLMEVFQMAPYPGLDAGTIFLRDADFDNLGHLKRGDVILLTSDHYDFEMSLLPKRLFGRIFAEFMKHKFDVTHLPASFDKIRAPASWIGALRLLSHTEGLNIDFDDAKLGFINPKTLLSDVDDMIRYYFARSKADPGDRTVIHDRLQSLIDGVGDVLKITCGKDFIQVMSLALNRFFQCCGATECSAETLSRMFRISVTQDDVSELNLYPALKEQVIASGFTWPGHPL